MLLVIPAVGQIITGVVFLVPVDVLVAWMTRASKVEFCVNHEVRIGSACVAPAQARRAAGRQGVYAGALRPGCYHILSTRPRRVRRLQVPGNPLSCGSRTIDIPCLPDSSSY